MALRLKPSTWVRRVVCKFCKRKLSKCTEELKLLPRFWLVRERNGNDKEYHNFKNIFKIMFRLALHKKVIDHKQFKTRE